MKRRNPGARGMHQGSECRKVFEREPSLAQIGALAGFTLVYRKVLRDKQRELSVLHSPVESLQHGGQPAPAHKMSVCDALGDRKVSKDPQTDVATGPRSCDI